MAARKIFFRFLWIIAITSFVLLLRRTPPFRAGAETILKGLRPLGEKVRQAEYSLKTALGGASLEERERLLAQNRALASQAFELESLRKERDALRRALSFQEREAIRLEGADVFFFAREFGKETLFLDKGRESGVAPGDAVLDADQLVVGRITEVGDGWGKADVIANAGGIFEFELPQHRISGLAKAVGGRSFTLDFIPSGVPVKKGDFVALGLPFSKSPDSPVRERRGKKYLFARVSGFKSGTSTFQEVRAVLLARPEILREAFIVRQKE
jgi:cell shape-determining protein MreC